MLWTDHSSAALVLQQHKHQQQLWHIDNTSIVQADAGALRPVLGSYCQPLFALPNFSCCLLFVLLLLLLLLLLLPLG
jgi:hypothetical protein